MGTVGDRFDCPQCGYAADYEFNYRTGEEWTLCPCCGRSTSLRRVIDRKRQREDPEHQLWPKLTKDGRPIFRYTEHPGYGAYRLASAEHAGSYTIGALKKPLSEAEAQDLVEAIQSDARIDAARSRLLLWDENTKSLVALLSQLSPDDRLPTEGEMSEEDFAGLFPAGASEAGAPEVNPTQFQETL